MKMLFRCLKIIFTHTDNSCYKELVDQCLTPTVPITTIFETF